MNVFIYIVTVIRGHIRKNSLKSIRAAACTRGSPEFIFIYFFTLLYQCRDPGCFPPPGIPPMPPELPYIPEVMFTVAITVPPLPVVFVAHPFSSAPETVIPTIAV